ncbi:MAG TPA: glycosyltransferase family 4 protein [Solirubrobacterales bacterium]|nr:glycosyltransferase family 4 protein [Solirubrobacterales bacterium]
MSTAAEDPRFPRVLHVVEAFGGGVFEVVRLLAEYLAEDGHPVAIAYGRRSETPEDVRAKISPLVELYPLPWDRRAPREQLAAARALRQLAAEWDHDVVHLHSSFAGVVGSLALPRSTPKVYTPHGYSFTMRSRSPSRRRLFKGIERVTARRVDAIGCVSEAEARDARQVASAEKVLVVRNGIPELDEPPSGPLPERPGRPRAVAVGRITEQRQPAAAARILASVADIADVSWIGGAGRGGIPESIVADEGVAVTGWLDRPGVLAALSSATAYLHWTAWDGQPLSILEAMAKDVVVIASDIEPCREVLGPRQVCAGEAEAGELMRRVLSDRGFREDLLSSQRQRSSLFGARRMAHEWRKVYERLAAPQPAALRVAGDKAERETKTMPAKSRNPFPGES